MNPEANPLLWWAVTVITVAGASGWLGVEMSLGKITRRARGAIAKRLYETPEHAVKDVRLGDLVEVKWPSPKARRAYHRGCWLYQWASCPQCCGVAIGAALYAAAFAVGAATGTLTVHIVSAVLVQAIRFGFVRWVVGA